MAKKTIDDNIRKGNINFNVKAPVKKRSIIR